MALMSFFIAKLPENAKKIEILLRFQRWMTKIEDEHSPSEVNVILNIWKL